MANSRLMRTEKCGRAAGKAASVSLHDLPGQFEKLSEDKADSLPSKKFIFYSLHFSVLLFPLIRPDILVFVARF